MIVAGIINILPSKPNFLTGTNGHHKICRLGCTVGAALPSECGCGRANCRTDKVQQIEIRPPVVGVLESVIAPGLAVLILEVQLLRRGVAPIRHCSPV
jgi:hypothetical protein